MQNLNARVIAYYLPQFHPIPENDEWWGKGFTEWRSVTNAKPLFKGHYQPHLPLDLGFYDLRVPEVREQQAELARNAGIEGFCYYHYWFGNGKQLLQRPFEEMLVSKSPDFPFCLCWANHDWSNKLWTDDGKVFKEVLLMKQTYSTEDYIKHFNYLLPAFQDNRYIRIDNKPCFVIWHPYDIPDIKEFIELWNRLALENGLDGIYFIANQPTLDYNDLRAISSVSFLKKPEINIASEKFSKVLSLGFNGVNSKGEYRAEYFVRSRWNFLSKFISRTFLKKHILSTCKQKDINKYLYVPEEKQENIYPTLLPNWDHSPRSGKKWRIYTESTPEIFKEQIKDALTLLEGRDDDHKILFLRAWNEWGEGNHIEPDCKYGHGYLDVLREALFR